MEGIELLIIAAVVIFIFALSRFNNSKKEKKEIDQSSIQPTNILPSLSSEDVERIPLHLRRVVQTDPFVQAIYLSVRRYKDLFQTFYDRTYICKVRTKRYVLQISIRTIKHDDSRAIHLELQGEHQHKFKLRHPSWIDRIPESKLEFFKDPAPDSGLNKEEVLPMLDPLSFFMDIDASPGILSAKRTVLETDSMEEWPQILGAFIRFARYLMDTAQRKEILAATDVLCPYCRGEFGVPEATVSCRDCKTRHHQECWEEVGSCSVFGCGSKAEIIITQS